MRLTFLKTLIQLAKTNNNIWLLTADLGYSVIEPFEKLFSERFINVGVAESNMAGIAAGLALEGKQPWIYSIANFPTLRCLEQIRNDICYHNLDVKIVSVGAGFSYGSAGYSHHGIEDLAIMKTLPNMTIATPADPYETSQITHTYHKRFGPTYLRLGKSKEPLLHQNNPTISIGKPIVFENGETIAIIASGSCLSLAIDAQKKLNAMGQFPTIVSMPFVCPIDEQSLKNLSETCKHWIVIEEHIAEGLCSSLSFLIQKNRLDVSLLPMHLKGPLTCAGSQPYLRQKVNFTSDAIINLFEVCKNEQNKNQNLCPNNSG